MNVLFSLDSPPWQRGMELFLHSTLLLISLAFFQLPTPSYQGQGREHSSTAKGWVVYCRHRHHHHIIIIVGLGMGLTVLCTLANCSTNEYCLWPCFILLMELYLKEDGVDSRKTVIWVTMVITALLCGGCWLKRLSCIIWHAISTAVWVKCCSFFLSTESNATFHFRNLFKLHVAYGIRNLIWTHNKLFLNTFSEASWRCFSICN